MAATLIVKWAYRHGVLGVSEHDSLDEAVAAALDASDDGSEALESIEVVEANGASRVLGYDEVERLWEPLEQAERELWRSRPAAVAVVRMRAPDGSWVTAEAASTREEAEQEAERLRSSLGADRVRIDPIS